MIYTVSDLHGCLEDWQTLLDTIHFSDQDTMFVLGDCVDLGPDPIGLLHDMFANTAGIAAAACTLTAMIQPSILGMFLPRDAANDFAPTYRSLGFSSYMSYTTLICLVINTVYVALSTFSLYNWQTTVIAIVGSTALTTAIIMLVDAIVHTRDTGR